MCGEIEQIAEGEGIVNAHRDGTLIGAGAPLARVVQRDMHANREGLFVADDQFAEPRLRTGFDSDIGLHSGHALEVFQTLLQIAQVQYVACTNGQGIEAGGALAMALREINLADQPFMHHQKQLARGQVLRRGGDAGGDPAFDQQGLLQTGKDHTHPPSTQATPPHVCRVGGLGHVRSQPVPGSSSRRSHLQQEGLDDETR